MRIIQANKKTDENISQAKIFHDVFISYSRRDKDFVRRLHDALEALNREAWVDWSAIPPTAKWLAEIFAGIEAADTFICVLSPDFLASSVCAQEVEHAIKYKKRLIPIVCRDVNPDDVNPELAALNWIFFRPSDDFDDAFKKLIEALDTDLDYIRMSSRLLVRAREWENNRYNSSFTLRGNDLEKAEQWRDQATAADKKPSPSELQLRYITSSRRVAVTRQRIAFGAVTFGLIVTLILSFLSFTLYEGQQNATRQALDNLAIAVSRQLATEADLQAGSNPQLAALLSVAAFKTKDTPEARTSLLHQLDRVQHIDQFLSSNSGPVSSVAFSPDGRILASESKNITLWDVANGSPLVTLPGNGDRFGDGIAFSPDGKMLAIAGSKEGILWDVARHIQLATFPGSSGKIAFSPDGHTLVLGGDSIVFWDVVKHVQIFSLPEPMGSSVLALTLSPDGSMLATEGQDGSDIILWDIAKRAEIADLRGGHTRGVWSLAFSPDGKILASGGHDAKIVLWNVAQHTQLANFDATGDVYDLAFSPDEHTLATADAGKNVILWDVVGHKRLTILIGHTAGVNSLAFSPDGSTLASGSDDNNIILWNLTGRNKLFLGSLPTHNTSSNLAFSPDGRILADGETGKVVLWDVARQTQLVTLPGAARIVAFSPDGLTLATADPIVVYNPDGSAVGGNRVILWDVASHKRLATLTSHTAPVTNILFSPDGKILATAAWDGRIILWNIMGHEQLATLTFSGPHEGVSSLAFSPDGKILASGGFGNIVFWDVAQHIKLFTLPGNTPAGTVMGLAFSPDGHTFASTAQEGAYTTIGCAGCKVIIWDLTKRAEIAELSGHIHEPLSVSFSVDGGILASSAYGDKVILWSVAQAAQITSLADGADLAVFSPDGRILATNYFDQWNTNKDYVDLWNFSIPSWLQILCKVAGRDLTQREWASYLPPDRPYQPICRL